MKKFNLEISNPNRENLHIKLKKATVTDFRKIIEVIPFAAPNYSFNDKLIANMRVEVSTEDYERVLDFDIDVINYFGLELIKVYDETNKVTKAFPTKQEAIYYVANALVKVVEEGTDYIL